MSLYELERAGDVEELVRVLRESDKEQVRVRAAELLGGFEGHDERESAITALVEAADGDSEPVTAEAIDSLASLGTDAIEQLVISMSGMDIDAESADWKKAKAFTRALTAETAPLRMAAANALGRLEVTDAVDPLTDAFDDPDPRVRARAARACGRLDDPRATTPLADRLTDSNPTVRREAAEALGVIASRQALQALLPLYEDEDERVRRVAVGAFGNFDNDRPVEYLVESLTDDSLAVRRTAVYSLVELMANVPTDRSHELRETVVDQLSAMEDRSVIVPLVEILEETKEPQQQRNTTWLLGRVTGEAERERVIDALIGALEADDEMVRQFAATSLAKVGDETVEARLLPLIKDESVDVDVRAQAIFTLGKIGGERSRTALDVLLDETEHDKLRERAFSAISKLGGRS